MNKNLLITKKESFLKKMAIIGYFLKKLENFIIKDYEENIEKPILTNRLKNVPEVDIITHYKSKLLLSNFKKENQKIKV